MFNDIFLAIYRPHGGGQKVPKFSLSKSRWSCDEQNCWFYGSLGPLHHVNGGITKSRPICCCACSLSSFPFFMRNLDLRTCNLSTITFVLSLLLIINNSPTRFIWFLASKSLLRRSVWLQWWISGIPKEIDDCLIDSRIYSRKHSNAHVGFVCELQRVSLEILNSRNVCRRCKTRNIALRRWDLWKLVLSGWRDAMSVLPRTPSSEL